MADKKLTKKEILNAIKAVAEQDVEAMFNDEVSARDVIEYVDLTIAQLESKNEKARERAAKAKAEGDEIRDKIEAVLTNEFKTIGQIIAEIGDETLTAGKVVSRMGQLIKLDRAVKTDVKVGSRKVKGYAAAGTEVADE